MCILKFLETDALDLININLLRTKVKNIFQHSCIITGLKLQTKEKYCKNNIYRRDNSGPLTIGDPPFGVHEIFITFAEDNRSGARTRD